MKSIEAQPFPYAFDFTSTMLVIIDMQRDFIEPAGFGESLGNDVSRLSNIIPTCRSVLNRWRAQQGKVLHTREAHLADLSDCPPSKLNRGNPTLKIGDEGPMGRILIAGQAGADIIPELAPMTGEWVIDKPGKGMFYRTGLHEKLQSIGITHLIFMGVTTEVCVQTSMREANDRGYECLLLEDCTESYFPQFKQATLEMIRAQGGIVGWTAESPALLRHLG
jgi:nicotinamidase-related amidase